MAGSEDPAPVVVCDAGPLIHLDQVGCVDLLHDFAEVLVPPIVWEEVKLHRSTALSGESEKFVRASAINPLSAELEALSRLLALHRGEVEALQVAQAHPGCILLTDDTAARLAGRSLGLVVHGTLAYWSAQFAESRGRKTKFSRFCGRCPRNPLCIFGARCLRKYFGRLNNYDRVQLNSEGLTI